MGYNYIVGYKGDAISRAYDYMAPLPPQYVGLGGSLIKAMQNRILSGQIYVFDAEDRMPVDIFLFDKTKSTIASALRSIYGTE
jgi:hypothetical protein